MFHIPYTKWTTNVPPNTRAINYWWGVKQKPNLDYGLATYGEETAEYNYKFNRAILPAIAVLFGAGTLAFHLSSTLFLAIPLALFVGLISFMVFNRQFGKSKNLEYTGKAASLEIALLKYDVTEEWWIENRSTRSLYNNLAYQEFAGVSKEEIIAGIQAKRPAAKAWVAKHLSKIMKEYSKHNTSF